MSKKSFNITQLTALSMIALLGFSAGYLFRDINQSNQHALSPINERVIEKQVNGDTTPSQNQALDKGITLTEEIPKSTPAKQEDDRPSIKPHPLPDPPPPAIRSPTGCEYASTTSNFRLRAS